MPRFAARVVLVAIFAILALPFAGCEEECSTQPAETTGQITGRITAPGVQVIARVTAYCMEDSSGAGCSVRTVQAETDSSGAFSISVFPGRYILNVWLHGPAWSVSGLLAHGSLAQSNVDTLIVEAGGIPIRADLPLGAARIELATPTAYEGEPFGMILAAQDAQRGIQVFAEARASGGMAVFYYPVVPAGQYRMRVSMGHGSFWLPGSYTEAEGEAIVIEAGLESTYEATMQAPATLRGTITGSWQELNLLRPTLSLFNADSIRVASEPANEDGTYSINVLGPIRARLLIRIEGVQRWEGGDSFRTATEFDLQPSQQTEVNIVESAIAGDLDQASHVYLDDAIRLYDASGRVVATTSSGDDGAMFFFPNLRTGTYFVHIPSGPTWIDHWYDGVDSFDQATPVEITSEGQVRWIYPTLMPGATISGTVLDAQGRPIVAASIGVTPGDQPREIYDRRTRAGSDGAFEIRSLSDGSYKLGARTPAEGTVWYPNAASWDSAGTVTIQGHEDVTGIVIRFGR